MSEPIEPSSPMNRPESEPARTDANDGLCAHGIGAWRCPMCAEARSAAAAQPATPPEPQPELAVSLAEEMASWGITAGAGDMLPYAQSLVDVLERHLERVTAERYEVDRLSADLERVSTRLADVVTAARQVCEAGTLEEFAAAIDELRATVPPAGDA